jgi:hypothetical protein
MLFLTNSEGAHERRSLLLEKSLTGGMVRAAGVEPTTFSFGG